ncbi:acylneuraminate cytidylyltransferase family protein [Akkermansiaceae bacterium]|nr:acylneuraminate cytidylyltransferase family protein [Akkermansiaceae bacterium]
MRVLAIIPARGGSKGVANKNIRPLHGKSLIQRTFEVARRVERVDKIVLSTDRQEIADHGKALGIEVPFIRPDNLAGDRSPMIGVVLHCVEWLLENEGYEPDVVILLQPTSPLRACDHIEDGLSLLKRNDAVCSVVKVPSELSPHYLMKRDNFGHLKYFLEEGRNIHRRQDSPSAFQRDGTVYISRVDSIKKYKDLYGKCCEPLILDKAESLSIDTEEDWDRAEKILRLKELH